MEHDPVAMEPDEDNDAKIARETLLKEDDEGAIDLDPSFRTNFSTQRALT